VKTIGLLGGTGWPSTIRYYTLINELVNERLGGFHSAKIILKSIDYHDIKSNYGSNPEKIEDILLNELIHLTSMEVDCIIICCNSLHKYYDMIKGHLYPDRPIPVFHAIELVAEHLKKQNLNNVLLLATKATLEDGFFAQILKNNGIQVTIPDETQRDAMQKILSEELVHNIIKPASKNYFADIIKQHSNLDAVVLGCTEYGALVDSENSVLPIVDPVMLQVINAVDFALKK